ncbi:MAG TPA: membrane protein insertase YidC, partial [bacterium]|nr:membrane protein insertase YidC [bacterium]
MEKYQKSPTDIEYTEIPIANDTTVILANTSSSASDTLNLNSKQQDNEKKEKSTTAIIKPEKIQNIEKITVQTITKTTKNYTIEFTNTGASISNIYLNNFKVVPTPDTLNIINSNHAVLNENILGIDIDKNFELSKVNYSIAGQTDTQIIFEYRTKGYFYNYDELIKSELPENLTIRKIYTINDDSYLIKLDLQIEKNENNTDFNKLANIEITSAETTEKFTGGLLLTWRRGIFVEHDKPNNFVYYLKNSLKKIDAKEGVIDPKFSDQIYRKVAQITETDWFGINSNYFLAVVRPLNAQSNIINLFSTKTNIGFQYLTTPLNFNDKTLNISFDLFVGPKEYYLLKNAMPNTGLEKTMDYGWFEALALILLRILKFFYSFIPNYGIAIILLTLLLNFIMYPLRAKSMRAMDEMKKLQPKLQELKEKYADDKMKIHQETMRLYKEHNINPFGGCLPMLLQLPIFIGLYRMLEYAIELRGAEFLYIKDLSAADPTYILPL